MKLLTIIYRMRLAAQFIKLNQNEINLSTNIDITRQFGASFDLEEQITQRVIEENAVTQFQLQFNEQMPEKDIRDMISKKNVDKSLSLVEDTDMKDNAMSFSNASSNMLWFQPIQHFKSSAVKISQP